jgi:hypothetical protein
MPCAEPVHGWIPFGHVIAYVFVSSSEAPSISPYFDKLPLDGGWWNGLRRILSKASMKADEKDTDKDKNRAGRTSHMIATESLAQQPPGQAWALLGPHRC